MDDGLLPVDYRVKYRLHCPTMLGFLDHWKQHYQPPAEFVDYLMDYDLNAVADCVRWVLEQPVRASVNEELATTSAYYPYRTDADEYFWRIKMSMFKDNYCHCVLWFKKAWREGLIFTTFNIAICWLFEQFEKHRPDLTSVVGCV